MSGLQPLPRPMRAPDRPRGGAGQSVVELALILPVLLLLLLVAVDFGRVYLGYINLQQMTRVAANYAAEHASAWGTPPQPAILLRYQEMVENDASAINCKLQRDDSGNLPGPAFVDGNFALGSRVEVRISCQFALITPIISAVLGNDMLLSSSLVYPIREGAVAEVPGGGAPILIAPVANFVGTPQSGYEPLAVEFTDTSLNGPTNWTWDFGNGSAFTRGPHVRTYECDDSYLPGQFCQFDVSLAVGNLGGFDTETKADYITVWVPPDTGPIADFTGTPLRGTAPLTVAFNFVDVRGGGVTYSLFEWDLENDGTLERSGATLRSVSRTYGPGTYGVTLRVTDGTGATHSLTKLGYVIVDRRVCTVPDFAGVKVSNAQARWSGAGFTTTVTKLPPPAKGAQDYKITYQSLVGGRVDPQPLGCDSPITVGP